MIEFLTIETHYKPKMRQKFDLTNFIGKIITIRMFF
jgi:hypothetical protein